MVEGDLSLMHGGSMDCIPVDSLDPVLSPTLPEARTSTATSDIYKYHLGHNIPVGGGSHPGQSKSVR